jgi:hypothetical protein
MKADGFKMPRVGWCVRMSNGQEICQDNRGYYLIGQPKEKEQATMTTLKVGDKIEAVYSSTLSNAVPSFILPTPQTHDYLSGHTSPETAYIVNDYPFGFRLRCKIRYWIERKAKNGDRFVSQTTNPKLSFEKWNAPKPSTYCQMRFLVRDKQAGDTKGHISDIGMRSLHYVQTLEFVKTFWLDLLSPEDKKEFETLYKISKIMNKYSWDRFNETMETLKAQIPQQEDVSHYVSIMRHFGHKV